MINLSNLRRRSRRSRRGTSLPPTGCGSSGPIVAPHYPSPPVEMPRRAKKKALARHCIVAGSDYSPGAYTCRQRHHGPPPPHPTPHQTAQHVADKRGGGWPAGARSGLATQTRSFAFVGFFPKTRSTTPERCMTLYGNHPHTLLTMRPLTSPPGHDTIRDRGHPLTAGRSQRLTPSIQTLQQASRTTAKSVFLSRTHKTRPRSKAKAERRPPARGSVRLAAFGRTGFPFSLGIDEALQKRPGDPLTR